MKIELAPEFSNYAKHFGEMLARRSGIRATEEEALEAFITSIALSGDLIVEKKDAATLLVTARSFKE